MKSKHLFRIGLGIFLCSVMYIVLPMFIYALQSIEILPWIVYDIVGAIVIAVMASSVVWDAVSFSKITDKSSLILYFWARQLARAGATLLALLWFGFWYVTPRFDSPSPPSTDIIKVADVSGIIMIALFVAAVVVKAIGVSRKKKIEK